VDHLAIDIGGRESQLCRRTADGKLCEERRLRTSDLPAYFRQLEPQRVIFESCAESFWLADAAKAAGHDVRIVPSTLVKTLGVGARKTKNDVRDARVLSEVSCRIELPSIHISSRESRERKTMLSVRDGFVASRTMMVNTVRGWMRGNGIKTRSGEVPSFPKRVRDACASVPVPPFIEQALEMITTLTGQLVEMNRALRAAAKKDERCQRLMSVPGVGPLVATSYISTLDDVARFPSAHAAESYLGLTPGENSSSDRVQRTGITKAGSTRTRWHLVQAAWTARRVAPEHPMVRWSLEVEKRRGKKVAIVALARKIAGILFALWRDGTLYSSNDGVKEVTPNAA
jgi:transposase